MTIDIAIIGGGLSGLAVADGLARAGLEWALFEARDRLGGRVFSPPSAGAGVHCDLGPSWIWPHNARMLAAAERFDLDLFPQYADGNLVFQDKAGAVSRDHAFSTMAGSLRVANGIGTLIDAIAGRLPAERLHQGCAVTRITDEGGTLRLDITGPDGSTHERARRVVFALPPRIVGATITTVPELPDDTRAALRQTPTWMAGHAKTVAVYETPFWRDKGLSGDAISHQGPLTEIHDASPFNGPAGALFGFVGTPANHRRGQATAIEQAARAQLVDLFGPEAADPIDLIYQDWAIASETATELDFAAITHHPPYGMPASLLGLWQGRLDFAGTEVAETEGGYLEGALEAAEACISRIG